MYVEIRYLINMMPYCTFFLGFLDIKPIKGGLEIDHGSSLIYIIPCSIIHEVKKNDLFFKEKKHYKHDAHDKFINTYLIHIVILLQCSLCLG